MEQISAHNVARAIDVSCVRTDVSLAEIDEMVEAAKRYHFIAAFAMPCYTQLLCEKMEGEEQTIVGGVVGFPSGADTTEMKIKQLQEMKEIGVREIDMVINVGALISHNDDYVYNEIQRIVTAAHPLPVKCILEICYLTDEEIRRGSAIVMNAGADYVKTGTGWGPRPTTVETIRIIKETVGDRVKIKAAGGVRDLDTLRAMMDAGCSRFGIGVKSAVHIMEQLEQNQ